MKIMMKGKYVLLVLYLKKIPVIVIIITTANASRVVGARCMRRIRHVYNIVAALTSQGSALLCLVVKHVVV